MGEESLSFRRQGERPGGPVDEANAEILLQRRQLPGRGHRGDAQRARRLGEAAAGGDLGEDGQGQEIHHNARRYNLYPATLSHSGRRTGSVPP